DRGRGFESGLCRRSLAARREVGYTRPDWTRHRGAGGRRCARHCTGGTSRMVKLSGSAWRAGLVGAVVLALAGCGSGAAPTDQGQPTPAETATPTPQSGAIPARSITAEPTAAGTPTPAPLQPSGPGQSFTSPLYNYTITVPRDWEVGPGAGKIGSVAS